MIPSLARATPFKIDVPEETLEDLQRRLERFRPPSEPVKAGWRFGVEGQYLRGLIDYWRHGFDWRAAEARLNRHAHYRVPVHPNGQPPVQVHMVYAPAPRADAPVVLLTPGWPSSLIEYDALIDHLTQPERFGRPAHEAVSVIAAELPGFGLSGRPQAPMPAREMAGLWRELMVDALGVERFVMHGGDWGAVVGSWLALDHPSHLRGLHMTVAGFRPAVDHHAEPLSDDEKAWLGATKRQVEADNGYAAQQGTKPSTLAVGLSDSPAALAAWLIEKYHGWCGAGPDEAPPFDADQLLTAATLYWTLGDLPAANWIYWAERHHGGIGLAPGQKVETPTGVALFAKGVFPIAPRRWIARAYNLVSYETFPMGGHFPGWLTPAPLAQSLASFVAAARPSQNSL